MTISKSSVTASKLLSKGIKRILIICVLANWTVLILYFWKFAPGHLFQLSNDQEIWAHFGTFYSGLLTPFLSFVAFIAIVLTVLLQAQQLDLARVQLEESKKQTELQEIQRVLSGVATNVDEKLNRKITFFESKPFVQGNLETWTVGTSIGSFGHAVLNPQIRDTSKIADLQAKEAVLYRDIEMPINGVVLEFESMAWCMNAYRARGGSEDVLGYYTQRYGAWIGWLDAMKEFESESRIYSAFDVPNIVRGLKTDQ